MTDTLKKEIHARHIAFLHQMQRKAMQVSKQTNKTGELFTLDAAMIDALRPRWKRHALELCKKHDVEFAEIISATKVANVVLARQEICWHMAKNLKMSLTRIGELLKRDHTTVMNSVRRHQKVLDDASKQV